MAAAKGNQYARKSKDWEAALRRAIERHSSGMAMTLIADKVVSQAIEGEWRAIEEIANRLDGKPSQSIDATVTHREATGLTDEQLADIATGRSAGAAEPQESTDEPSGIH